MRSILRIAVVWLALIGAGLPAWGGSVVPSTPADYQFAVQQKATRAGVDLESPPGVMEARYSASPVWVPSDSRMEREALRYALPEARAPPAEQQALNEGARRALDRTPVPSWVLRGGVPAALDFDFQNGRYYQALPATGRAPSQLLTVSRATVGYIDDLAGLWVSVPANTARVSNKGLLVEEARTNLALWCRDLTNAAWVKTTMTTALTATGIDGNANSATTITAAGALSTILQTVVQASTADTVSFFIKRRTGSGTVEITGDGAAYTDVTASLSTTAWFRASVSATLVNPVLGVRITTSGDAVDVDFAQLEAGTFKTSPILTTTASVARAADAIMVVTPPSVGSAASMFVRAQGFLAPDGYANNQFVAQISSGANTNRMTLFRAAATGNSSGFSTSGGVTVLAVTGGNIPSGSSAALAIASATGDQIAVYNGSSIGTAAGAFPIGMNSILLGSGIGGNSFLNAYFARFALWPTTRLPNASLTTLTAANDDAPQTMHAANDDWPVVETPKRW